MRKNFFSLLPLFFLLMGSIRAELVKVPTEITGKEDLRAHPGHYPFISYLTFRNVCDVVIDQTTEWFDPDSVKQGDIIYLHGSYLEWFTKKVHPKIKYPYILFTGDIGAWFPKPSMISLLYDSKLAAWFCRNMVFSYHPKLVQSPMGQDLALFKLEPEVVNSLIDAVKKKPVEKKHWTYLCIMPRAHGNRDTIVKRFKDQPFCLYKEGAIREQFYEDIAASRFTFSPLGWETDCVRTWEALVLDSIPIVEHTFLDPSYERLPVAIVHDWEEITPAFLEKKYQELKDRSCEEAYFDYWQTLLQNFQRKVRQNDLAFSELEATQFTTQDLDDLSLILSNYRGRPLLYKGFLSALRPLQLLSFCPFISKIDLYDPWLDQKMFTFMQEKVKTKSYLAKKDKISVMEKEKQFNELLQASANQAVFLDLTYYRTSLSISFSKCVIEEGNFRHSLKKDLKWHYDQLQQGSLLCGNMRKNEYVQEVLAKLSSENGLQVKEQGNFWFLKKEIKKKKKKQRRKK